MNGELNLHTHAISRFKERYGLDEDWLAQELENGRFVWLKGTGNCGDVKRVRSGHLLYIPDKDEYCVVVMDDRSRLAITVLTEKMALNSSWAKGIDGATKLRAKQLALGRKKVNGSHFLQELAEESGGVSVNVQARVVLYGDWRVIVRKLLKITIKAEQINLTNNCCTLTISQMDEVSKIIKNKVFEKEARPYCDLFVSKRKDNAIPVSNDIKGISSLEFAEQARRWNV